MEKINSLPVVDSLRYAVQVENSNAHPKPTWSAAGDYSRARPSFDLAYADALGEEKAVRAKCAVVVLCCRLLSLVDRYAGRAGQRLAMLSSELFPHPISGIVMSNQNAARSQGTLQPPHHSVRFSFRPSHSTGLHFVTGISNRSFADNAVFISTLTI